MSMEPETFDAGQEALSFDVTDVYYDGATLIFWVATQNDFFDLSDHVYINEIDSRLEYVAETQEGSGVYECKVSVVDQELQKAAIDSLHVKVGVYTAPDKKSDYAFTVESDKFVSASQREGAVSDLRFGKVVSYSVTVSPSVINLHLDWEVYEEEMVQILQWGGYLWRMHLEKGLRMLNGCALAAVLCQSMTRMANAPRLRRIWRLLGLMPLLRQ